MILLMPSFGVFGVIIAALISAALEIVLLRNGIKDMFQFRFNFFKIVGAPLILFIMIVVLEPIDGAKLSLYHSPYLSGKLCRPIVVGLSE